MADHQNGAGVLNDDLLQPLDGVQVQLVGGLVQQDDVRAAEQGLGQQHLDLFAVGDGAHLLIQDGLRQAQPLDQAGGVGFRLPAAHLGVLALQLGGADAVLVGEIFFGVQGVLFLPHLVQPFVAHDHGVQHRIFVKGEVVLAQHRHPHIFGHGHRPGGRLQLPLQNAEEGGFARAVGADDAVAVAGGELQVHVLEQGLLVEGHAQVRNDDHVTFSYRLEIGSILTYIISL